MTETKTTPKKASTSKKHQGLHQAIAALQADLPDVKFDQVNPHFKSKFASLANISKEVLPKLSAQGLTFVGTSRIDELGRMIFVVKLTHSESGEYEQAEYLINATDPQKIGSAETYFRRYGLAKLTGVVADGDDDGNTASAPEPRNLSQARENAFRKAPASAPARGADPKVNELKKKIRDDFISKGTDKDVVNELVKQHQNEGLTGAAVYEAVIKELESN